MRKLGKMKFDALVDAVSAADFMNPLGHRPVFGTAHRCLVIHRRAIAAALAVGEMTLAHSVGSTPLDRGMGCVLEHASCERMRQGYADAA